MFSVAARERERESHFMFYELWIIMGGGEVTVSTINAFKRRDSK